MIKSRWPELFTACETDADEDPKSFLRREIMGYDWLNEKSSAK
jgi:hypothetical protein